MGGGAVRGQLSAEMLILVVVIFAIVAVAATQLVSTAKETSGNIQNQTERLNIMTAEAIKSPEGGACITSDDCEDGYTCEDNRCA